MGLSPAASYLCTPRNCVSTRLYVCTLRFEDCALARMKNQLGWRAVPGRAVSEVLGGPGARARIDDHVIIGLTVMKATCIACPGSPTVNVLGIFAQACWSQQLNARKCWGKRRVWE